MTSIPDHFKRQPVDGDDLERLVCQRCDFIHYENPKLVVGAVVKSADGRILMCRRAIEPQKGLWTIPAGFMELGETPGEGAAREAYEEATAHIEIRDLLAVYSLKHISQVQMMFRATLKEEGFAPGVESLEVALFHFDEMPWKELAFPSVHWALRQDREAENLVNFAPYGNPD